LPRDFQRGNPLRDRIGSFLLEIRFDGAHHEPANNKSKSLKLMNAALPDTPPGLASSFEHFTCLFGATLLSYDASQVESVFTKLLLRHIQSNSTIEGL
jgi:hypothetical protein